MRIRDGRDGHKGGRTSRRGKGSGNGVHETKQKRKQVHGGGSRAQRQGVYPAGVKEKEKCKPKPPLGNNG